MVRITKKRTTNRSPVESTDYPSFPMVEALGQSEAFLEFQERLSRVAQVERPVLLMGERGTGKEIKRKTVIEVKTK